MMAARVVSQAARACRVVSAHAHLPVPVQSRWCMPVCSLHNVCVCVCVCVCAGGARVCMHAAHDNMHTLLEVFTVCVCV